MKKGGVHMLCLYTIALMPGKVGHLHKVSGETLEELQDELLKYPRQSDDRGRKHSFVDNPKQSLTLDQLIDMAADIWDMPESTISLREVTRDFISRGDFKAARFALGVMPQEFADMLNIRARTINAWIQGRWPIPPGVGDDVHKLLAEQDEAVKFIADEYERGCDIIYDKIYFKDKPQGWNRRVLQRAMTEYGIELFLEDETIS